MYPADGLFEQLAYLAYHLHWPPEELMSMEHHDRHRWVDEVAKLNERINEG